MILDLIQTALPYINNKSTQKVVFRAATQLSILPANKERKILPVRSNTCLRLAISCNCLHGHTDITAVFTAYKITTYICTSFKRSYTRTCISFFTSLKRRLHPSHFLANTNNEVYLLLPQPYCCLPGFSR
jgi:hypothetical protein